MIALLALVFAAQPAAAPYSASHPLPKPALFLPGIVSTGDDDAHVTFAPDGRTLYFVKSSPKFDHWTLAYSRYANGRWSAPEVAPFSGQYNDADLLITKDGKTAYFISNRPFEGKPKDDTDIWTMTATADGWGEPRHVAELSSQDGNEWYPTMTDSGTIYFGSERREGNLGAPGTSDLWRARLVDGHYAAPENLGPTINTAGNDIEAWVSPDERFIVFASNARPDTRGSYDLYISYHRDGRWSEPKNLGDAVNGKGWEFGPRVSPDGRYLFFTSNRGFTDEPLTRRLSYRELTERLRSPGNGMRDVYQVDIDVLPTP